METASLSAVVRIHVILGKTLQMYVWKNISRFLLICFFTNDAKNFSSPLPLLLSPTEGGLQNI